MFCKCYKRSTRTAAFHLIPPPPPVSTQVTFPSRTPTPRIHSASTNAIMSGMSNKNVIAINNSFFVARNLIFCSIVCHYAITYTLMCTNFRHFRLIGGAILLDRKTNKSEFLPYLSESPALTHPLDFLSSTSAFIATEQPLFSTALLPRLLHYFNSSPSDAMVARLLLI